MLKEWVLIWGHLMHGKLKLNYVQGLFKILILVYKIKSGQYVGAFLDWKMFMCNDIPYRKATHFSEKYLRNSTP